MADDIKISGVNASQQGGAAPGQGQSAGAQLNPVIDLRNLDETPPPAAAGTAPTAAGATAQAGAGPQTGGVQVGTDLQTGGVPVGAGATAQVGATPAAAGPPTGRRNAIMLGEEEVGQAAPEDKYAIPTLVKDKFPDLIQLIKETESMNDEERDYWFQILPIMTEEQIKKFRDILVNEKEQLASLDKEYETELTKLNEKHMIEWKEFETKEKRKSITTAESASKQQEQAQEEDLLKRLSQV